MNIGIVTTSRADFGIYIPLLNQIKNQGHSYFLFAGGMHTLAHFGNSYQLIEKEGFEIAEKVEGMINDDSQEGITLSMSNTLAAYGTIWKKYKDKLDVVFVLGDRYEMYAAASSVVPFNIPLAHLHGGETTLGAIDNKFRHAITMLSEYHFTSHAKHAEKVLQMTGSKKVLNVGAMGVEALLNQSFMDAAEFKQKFNFDISQEFILCTIHPETVAVGKNKEYIHQFLLAVDELNLPVLCTLPNADTEGSVLRKALLAYAKVHPQKLICHENLGVKGYFTAMKNCALLVGNTSSGIIEAASFKKWVINLGQRQEGRFAPDNVVNVDFEKNKIIAAVKEMLVKDSSEIVNPYGQGDSSKKILEGLKIFLSK